MTFPAPRAAGRDRALETAHLPRGRHAASLSDQSGAEIDFVVERRGRYIPIEVKSTEHPTLHDARHVPSFLSENGKKAPHGFVICRAARPLALHLSRDGIALVLPVIPTAPIRAMRYNRTVTAAEKLPTPKLPTPADPRMMDHFVYLRDVSFREYEALLAMRGDRSVPRITYLHGVLELMSPSRYHESDKKKLARVVEAWAEEQGVLLEGFGSWTLKNSREERGAEPNECYTVNRIPPDDERERPDIALEVIWTSGGLDKLEVYRKLGVREVWIYERGTLSFFALRGEVYEACPRSELLPALDPGLVTRCMAEPSQTAAVQALRAVLAG